MKNIFKKIYIKIGFALFILLSFGVATADVLSESLWSDTDMCSGTDPKTGMTCDEIEENPGVDLYYIVNSSHFDDDIWKDSHQNRDTTRWDLAHTKFIVKYDASEIPRREFGLEKALGVPMNHDEIAAYLLDPLNGFYFDEDAPVVLPPEELLPPEEIPPVIEELVVPEPTNPEDSDDPTEPVDPDEPLIDEPTDDPNGDTIPPDSVTEEGGGDGEGDAGVTDDGSEDEDSFGTDGGEI